MNEVAAVLDPDEAGHLRWVNGSAHFNGVSSPGSGLAEAGRIAIGAPAELLALSPQSVRTAGVLSEQIVFAANG